MKKTYITPQQYTVKVAPHNPLLNVSQSGLLLYITIGSDFDTETDTML